MCNYSKKLVAWLDSELPSEEMADVQRHLGDCVECQKQLTGFEQVSARFRTYCDALTAARTRRKQLPHWVPVLSTAAAVAIAGVLVIVLLGARIEPLALPPLAHAPPPEIIPETRPAPIKHVHRRRVTPRVPHQAVNWLPSERAIQISIPAESMFPPGAFPEGINFIADVSIASDGTAEQLRLRPRLIGFERRATQP